MDRPASHPYQPDGVTQLRANPESSLRIIIQLADIPQERRWNSEASSRHQSRLVRHRVKSLFDVQKGQTKWPQAILVMLDDGLDKPDRIRYAIASAKRFLAGIEWKTHFHSLCEDPMEAPHHNIGYRDRTLLPRLPCSRTLGEQHSLTAA